MKISKKEYWTDASERMVEKNYACLFGEEEPFPALFWPVVVEVMSERFDGSIIDCFCGNTLVTSVKLVSGKTVLFVSTHIAVP